MSERNNNWRRTSQDRRGDRNDRNDEGGWQKQGGGERKSGGGVYQPPGRRNNRNRRNRRTNSRPADNQPVVQQKQTKKDFRNAKEEFPTLGDRQNLTSSQTSSTKKSWSTICQTTQEKEPMKSQEIKRNDESLDSSQREIPFYSSQQVEDWTDRPKNNKPLVGPVIDLSQHQRKLREYRARKAPREVHLPEGLMSQFEQELLKDRREAEYWDRMYSEQPKDDEVDSEASNDEKHT